MSLPPKINHSITLAEARKFTGNFQKNAAPDAIKGGLFWKEAVENVLNQPGCVAMRWYYGQTDSGTPVMVFVGVDAEGRDMTKGFIAERTWPCPPICDAESVLNTTFRQRHPIDLRKLSKKENKRGVRREPKYVPEPANVSSFQ